MNGIQKISEYHIYVHPKCANTVKELSSYRYEVDGSDNGLNKPIDFDNHLMDAMRYALEKFIKGNKWVVKHEERRFTLKDVLNDSKPKT